jgi:formylglycine-generating enzyme required for sulfatase activity
MADIFISYTRKDLVQAKHLSDALAAEGWSVWWDIRLRAGQRFDDVIEQRIKDARCVIVLWSERSVKSQWVLDEAIYALELNKLLIPAGIEEVDLPLRFRSRHTLSLQNWDGAREGVGFRRLVEDIADLLGSPHGTGATPEQVEQAPESAEAPRSAEPVAGNIAGTSITADLLKTLQSAAESTEARRAAGLRLGKIGWRPDDLDAFMVVEPGDFPYGERLGGRRRIQRIERIDYRYWIGKYPVTNAQYADFLNDVGGVEKPECRTDDRWNNPIFPVVGVSWDEACAYCEWLGKKLRRGDLDLLGADGLERYTVRLPSGIEWQRAARGTDGRAYPWGDEFDATRANTRGDGIDESPGTTAVCTYPEGVSPVGAWDMAGNVWEWTSSGKGVPRLLRGGSWNHSSGKACSRPPTPPKIPSTPERNPQREP